VKLGSALFWTLFSVGTTSVLKLAGNLTLARLLTADAFGLVAVVFAITSGIEAITDVGTTPSLIRSQRTDPRWLDTAWTMGVIRGFGIAIAIALIAYPVAAFFKDERLVPLIAASGLMSILIGVKSNQAVLALRNLQAKTVAIVELVSAVAGYIVMLFWAWYAPSAWALLVGALVTVGVTTVLSFWAFGYRRVRFCWDRSVLTELVSFGKWVFFASLLGFFILQGDRIIIGRFLDLHSLGIYSIAFTWTSALNQLFFMFLGRLYMPVVAQFKRLGSVAQDVARLRYLILSAIVIPYALLAGTSEQLMLFLYPAGYAGAGQVMGILVVGAWFSGLEFIYNDQLMLEGRPSWRAYAQILSIFAIIVGLFAFGAQANLVLIAILFAAGMMVRGLMLMLANSRQALRLILPDLGLTGLFLVAAAAVKAASAALAEQHSPFIAVMVCGIVLAPFGAAIGWMAIRRSLALAGSLAPIQPDEAAAVEKSNVLPAI
jgi:O-antigen/teichoic acid export membrane protein